MKQWLLSSGLNYAICGLLLVIATPTLDGFASFANAKNILSIVAPLMLLAVGQMLVMIGGGIDLSCGAVVALTSVASALVMSENGGVLAANVVATPAAIVAAIMMGTAVGAMNGCSIALLRMPPFMVTLTSMMFGFGFSTWWTGSKSISALPASFIDAGTSSVVVVSAVVLMSVVIALFLNCTMYGRWLYATGMNRDTAVVSGVPTRMMVAATYILSGVLAALASLIYTAQLETGSPVLGEKVLLDVIGAVVIGGTSLFGGKGSVAGVFSGVLLITLIDNILNLMELSHFTVMIAKGCIILLAASFDLLRKQWRTV